MIRIRKIVGKSLLCAIILNLVTSQVAYATNINDVIQDTVNQGIGNIVQDQVKEEEKTKPQTPSTGVVENAPSSEYVTKTESMKAKQYEDEIDKAVKAGNVTEMYIQTMEYFALIKNSVDLYKTEEEKVEKIRAVILSVTNSDAEVKEYLGFMQAFLNEIGKTAYSTSLTDAYSESSIKNLFKITKHNLDFSIMPYKDFGISELDEAKLYQANKQVFDSVYGSSLTSWFADMLTWSKIIDKGKFESTNDLDKLLVLWAGNAADNASILLAPTFLFPDSSFTDDYKEIPQEELVDYVKKYIKVDAQNLDSVSLDSLKAFGNTFKVAERYARAQQSLGVYNNESQGLLLGVHTKLSITKPDIFEKNAATLKSILTALGIEYENSLSQVETGETKINSKDALDNLVFEDESFKGALQLRDNVAYGLALSSLYQPLETNVFNNQHLSHIVSTEFYRFHSNYGRLVKHLMISRDTKAVSKFEALNTTSNLKVATLKDLVYNTNSEKLLLASQNYYNIDDISIDSLEDDQKTSFQTWRSNDFKLNKDMLTKRQLGLKDSIVIDSLNPLEEELKGEDYSGLSMYLGMQTALSVAKDETSKKIFIEDNVEAPLFMSNKKPKESAKASVYYNYVLLDAIKDRLKSNYRVAVDLNSPIFVDIYGNIITDSGLVVIPAAANGTINVKYNFLTIAWLTNIDKFELPKSFNLNDTSFNDISAWVKLEEPGKGQIMSDALDPDNPDETLPNTYQREPLMVFMDNQFINLDSLNTMSTLTGRIIFNLNKELYKKRENTDASYMLKAFMYPVTKGTYPHMIDYSAEGLIRIDGETMLGLKQALKLENFIDSLDKVIQNTLFTIPDLRFVEGYELLAFNLWRLFVLLITVLVMMEIYFFAVRSRLTLTSFVNVTITVVLVLTLTMLLPKAYSVSYESSKFMLQNSLERVATLNYEKSRNDIEVGVIEARDAEKSASTIFIKIGEDKINSGTLLKSYMEGIDSTNVDKSLEESTRVSPFVMSHQYKKYANMYFLDVNTLFDSSVIATDTSTGMMQQYVKKDPDASFYLPYYAMVDYILYNINTYNKLTNQMQGQFQEMNDGTLRSVGVTTSYFKSDAFLITSKDMRNPNFEIPEGIDERVLMLANYDKSGVNQIYDVNIADARPIFSDKSVFQSSAWYLDGFETDASYREAVDFLDKEAVTYISKNYGMLGKITDEAVVKSLAMHMALAYNSRLAVPGPKSLEMIQLSTHDMLRVLLTNFEKMAVFAPYSYSHMVFRVAGTIGVYVAAAVEIMTRILSIVKPVTSLVIMVMFMIALTFTRIISKNNNIDMIKGYLKTIAILAVSNITYSALIMLSQAFPNVGVPPVMILIYHLVLNGGYLFILLSVLQIVTVNFKDLGNKKYESIFKGVVDSGNKGEGVQRVKIVDEDSAQSVRVGWDVYNQMKKDKARRGGNNEGRWR